MCVKRNSVAISSTPNFSFTGLNKGFIYTCIGIERFGNAHYREDSDVEVSTIERGFTV